MSLLRLPEEVLDLLCSYLDPGSILDLERTCTQLRHIVHLFAKRNCHRLVRALTREEINPGKVSWAVWNQMLTLQDIVHHKWFARAGKWNNWKCDLWSSRLEGVPRPLHIVGFRLNGPTIVVVLNNGEVCWRSSDALIGKDKWPIAFDLYCLELMGPPTGDGAFPFSHQAVMTGDEESIPEVVPRIIFCRSLVKPPKNTYLLKERIGNQIQCQLEDGTVVCNKPNGLLPFKKQKPANFQGCHHARWKHHSAIIGKKDPHPKTMVPGFDKTVTAIHTFGCLQFMGTSEGDLFCFRVKPSGGADLSRPLFHVYATKDSCDPVHTGFSASRRQKKLSAETKGRAIKEGYLSKSPKKFKKILYGSKKEK